MSEPSKTDQLRAMREAAFNRPRGRPRVDDKAAQAATLTALKPWVAAGMSRATWYKRRAEGKA